MSSINDYKVGMTVYGRINAIKPYGAFVEFENGITGLIHISEISNGFVKSIGNFVNVGEYYMLKIIDIDKEHKQLRLSFKAIESNTRRYVKKVKFEGMPNNIIGFASINEMMPKWMKEDNND